MARTLGEQAMWRGNVFVWWRPQRRKQRIKRWGSRLPFTFTMPHEFPLDSPTRVS